MMQSQIIPSIKPGHRSLLNTLSLAWNRLFPSWAERKIDSQLFLPNTMRKASVTAPRGFQEKTIDTPKGRINMYQYGAGPAVVFVHGWGGGAYQFFSLMRGLKACGFTAIAFDHLGHEKSENKAATLGHLIATTNFILQRVRKQHREGLYAIVAHDTGCLVTANARPALIKGLPLFLISPIFNYKLYFLKKLGELKLHPEILKQYAQRFITSYKQQYAHLELANSLVPYSDDCLIAHDRDDPVSPVADSVRFCNRHPLTKLLVTNDWGHNRIISSESVWAELKSHVNYEDTTINFSKIVLEEIQR